MKEFHVDESTVSRPARTRGLKPCTYEDIREGDGRVPRGRVD